MSGQLIAFQASLGSREVELNHFIIWLITQYNYKLFTIEQRCLIQYMKVIIPAFVNKNICTMLSSYNSRDCFTEHMNRYLFDATF